MFYIASKSLLMRSYCFFLVWALGTCFFVKAQSTAPYSVPTEQGEYITVVQQHTFKYFWDFAHPASGMIPERNATPNVCTSGGTGFGVMAIVTGVYRKWITRAAAVERLLKMTRFLEKADRFHGAWSHWLDGNTGKVVPFSQHDNGGDLVETAYLVNGLLVARAYFDGPGKAEVELRQRITRLWETVEWDWYVHNDKLHWHWSPQYEWKMNHPIGGYNECLITYILAMGSPTHPISKKVYEDTWKKHEAWHYLNGKDFAGYKLPIGFDWGGPLFFAHYSYLSLDPRQMQDEAVNYWQLNTIHTLINRAHCLERAPRSYRYSEQNWGLTASDNHQFYGAHQPTEDNGTITPSAALSSFPYTPYYSFQALMYLYRIQGNRLFGPMGFYDSYNAAENWYSNQYLAIDQGPIVVMIENYRSGLLWKLGENISELQMGLRKMGINKPQYKTGFYQYTPEVKSGLVHLMKHPDAGQYILDFYLAEAGSPKIYLSDQNGKITVLSEGKKLPSGPQQLPFMAGWGDYTATIENGTTIAKIKIGLR